MELSFLKDIAIFVGALIGLITFIKGVWEYSRNNAMKRAEYFATLQRELHELVSTTRLGELLEHESPEVATVSYDDKLRFLGFFEKVALMLNSGLVRKEVAHYMFAYYAILSYNNPLFWQNMDKNSYYWSLFCSFSKDMIQVRDNALSMGPSSKSLRF